MVNGWCKKVHRWFFCSMSQIKSIAVFCGSSSGNDMVFAHQAAELGRKIAGKGLHLIYGGASVGLMGTVADAALEAGGKVTGVFPGFLEELEISHKGLTELVITESMHERKMLMNELSEGVIALPGGFGTIEELFEMLTWAQLGLHAKPVGLLNVAGFYDGLCDLTGRMVSAGFLKEENMQLLLVESDIDILLAKMDSYVAPDVAKWLQEYRPVGQGPVGRLE